MSKNVRISNPATRLQIKALVAEVTAVALNNAAAMNAKLPKVGSNAATHSTSRTLLRTHGFANASRTGIYEHAN